MSDQQGGESLPQWAMDKAASLAGCRGALPDLATQTVMQFASDMQAAFARYIAEHEEAPDPVEVEVARLLPNADLHPLEVVIRNALKRGMELARQPQSPESTS